MRTVLAIVAGFAAAFAIMVAFEFTNSRLHPFPPGMDVFDIEQVRTFARNLPASALVMVALGWISGSFVGGWLATRLAPDRAGLAAFVVGLLLTCGATFNAWLVREPLWFHFGGLALFPLFAYVGWRVARRNSRPHGD